MQSVNLPEVLELISWLIALLGIPLALPDSAHYSSQYAALVSQAMQRAERLNICAQRVWALGSVAPGRELSLLSLVPPTDLGYSVRGHTGHDMCTSDFCQQSTISFTSVAQLHLCSVPGHCLPTEGMFSQALLSSALNRSGLGSETFVPTA